MSDITSPEFQAAFVRDSEAVAESIGLIRVDLDLYTGLALVSQLQLALRHPANRGESADVGRRFAVALIDRIAVTDVLRRGLEAGFDPVHDR